MFFNTCDYQRNPENANVGKVYNGLVSLFLRMIPAKCKSWKVANTPLLNYWCRFICGKTNGKLCEPWCKIVERYGLWTLMITIGLPVALLLLLLAY